MKQDWKLHLKSHPDFPGTNELISLISERYKPLPSAAHRVRFVDLQLELLDDYRIRLLQIRHEASQDPLSSVFLAILNTVNYIAEVLHEWKDLDVSTLYFCITWSVLT